MILNRRAFRFAATFFIVGSLMACSAPPAAVTPSTPTSAATATAVATAVVTETPSATLAPSATPAPTATAIPLATLGPKPTLTPDARPAIDTPKWFNQAVMYQIFPRSFYDTNGDGIGDLNGIREKLDYVQALGANTIWLNPHYPSTTYHGYDVVDYTAVNPQFGTLDDFKTLVAEMKKRGMHLFVDMVLNHSSNAHPFFKDAYKNPASKYTSWYHFRDDKNETYSSFFGVKELPEWNHDNPDVRKYLTDAALFWLDLGVDGVRCDYALGVERPYWQEFRAAIKAKHPDAVILGEVWESNPQILKRYFESGFDALFDFPWYTPFTGGADAVGKGVLNGNDDVTFLEAPFLLPQRLYPPGAQMVRFPSNHDTNRVASVVKGDALKMRLAAAATILTPGIPIVYYGEEIGMRGVKGTGPVYDELRREPMDWYSAETGQGMTTWFKPSNRNNKPNDGVSVEEEDKNADSLLSYYRDLIKLRNEHPALHGTNYDVMDSVPGCETCIGIWRWDEGEVVLTILNFGGLEHKLQVSAGALSPVDLPAGGNNASFILGGANDLAGPTIAPWSTIAIAWK